MIRTSKHNISNIANDSKLESLYGLFDDFKSDLISYIGLILDGTLDLKRNMSSKDLPSLIIKHSRYKQVVYKQASEIIRSQIKKASNKRYNKYKYVYKYFKESERQSKFLDTKYSELNLKHIISSKYFAVPDLDNISINLDNRFFDIRISRHFDSFVKIILPYFNDKGTRALNVKVPLKYHKHSNSLMNKGFELNNAIQLKKVRGKTYINLIWSKEEPAKRKEGKTVGIDIGYKKLLVTSDGQFIGTNDLFNLYNKISNKKRGSKNYNRSLKYKDNLINFYCNQLDLDNVNKLVLEDLKQVKHKSELSKQVNNKIQYWSYRSVLDKIERISEEVGITTVKVSPSYTSQTCSRCGSVHKESRKGELFKCIDCGYEIDADLNASINIHSRGVYSPSSRKERCDGFH